MRNCGIFFVNIFLIRVTKIDRWIYNSLIIFYHFFWDRFSFSIYLKHYFGDLLRPTSCDMTRYLPRFLVKYWIMDTRHSVYTSYCSQTLGTYIRRLWDILTYVYYYKCESEFVCFCVTLSRLFKKSAFATSILEFVIFQNAHFRKCFKREVHVLG